MQEFLLDLTDVPTTKEQFEAITGRLDGVESRLGILPDKPDKKSAFWPKTLAEWIGVGTGLLTFGACVCGVTLFFGRLLVDSHINEALKPISQRIEQTNEKLDAANINIAGMKATLDAWAPFIAPQVLKRSSSISQDEFNKSLPSLRDSMQVAAQAKASVPKETLQQIAQKLQRSPESSPDFWPTLSEFISYRSFNTSGALPANLPNCTDSPPAPFKVTQVDRGMVKGFANSYYENCQFRLDSAEDDQRINSFVKNGYPIIEFKHCLIVYKGGDFNLPTWSHLRDAPFHTITGNGSGAALNYDGPSLLFIECLFEFSVSNQVPQRGQDTLQALLHQDGPSLELPLKKSN